MSSPTVVPAVEIRRAKPEDAALCGDICFEGFHRDQSAARLCARLAGRVPTRNSDLLRWCLENGLRVIHPMTLMTIGLYNEPVGAYLPSILY